MTFSELKKSVCVCGEVLGVKGKSDLQGCIHKRVYISWSYNRQLLLLSFLAFLVQAGISKIKYNYTEFSILAY